MPTNRLGKIELFRNLSPVELQALSAHADFRSVPRGTRVISEGEATSALYAIVSGRVRVFVANPEGREVTLCILYAGDYFGELALLDGQPHSASVASMDACEFAVIRQQEFNTCLHSHASIAVALLRTLSIRIRRLTNQTRDLALLNVYARIVRTLHNLAQFEDGQQVIRGKLTHHEIARCVGASREMVSRIMKDLVEGGYVKSEGSCLIISENLPHAW